MRIPTFGFGRKPALTIHDKVFETIEDAQKEFALAPSDPLPTQGGRTSTIETEGLYGIIRGEMSQITPGFELELLKMCNHLAKYNGDVSYAVDNIVQLGNTPAVISFDSTVPKPQVEKMIAFLTEGEKNLYKGGMNSLQNDLFAQIAINGCISGEAIPSRSLDRLEKVALVDPYNIRFRYNPVTYEYDAYQKISDFTTGDGAGLIKLNPITYKYYALRLFNDNPYAIPPFISAFESMDVEKDMLKNLRFIVKKLGMFGFLSVLLAPPVRLQGETEIQFYNRAEAYLDKVRPQVEKGYSNGMNIGFKGSQEFKMEGGSTSVTGAKELLELITQFKSAGLKQDPLMLGRNFNVAETMAKVIMAKLTTQVANTQRVVARFRADLYYLMLVMGGYKLQSVTVEYSPPMIGDKLREAQAYAAEIDNSMMLRDKGIIGQQEAANNLGYEKPHAAKDVDYTVLNSSEKAASKVKKSTTDPNNTNDKGSGDPTAEGATNYRDGERQEAALTTEGLYFKLHKGVPEYVYEVANCSCGKNHSISYAAKDDVRLRTIDDYIALYKISIGKEYKKAVDKVTKKVGQALAELGEGAGLEQVTDRIIYILYTEWGAGFTKAQKNIVSRWVTDIYRYFRADDGAFPADIKAPKALFGLHDVRALQYFKSSDELYLGKFITDSDTKRRITEFIKQNYLFNGTPIGNNPEAIAAFQEAFGDLLNLEDWKIRRIIDTTVNTMRNYAAIAYIHQAEIQQYEVLGISDGLQCVYCRHMNGMRFDVAKAFERTDAVVKMLPGFEKATKPFVTSVFPGTRGVDEFIELDSEAIQNKGVDIPSYHPHCRCVVVAVL